jgi:1-deoxy-D-xylulose-5-phosphate reductoisomerase
MDGGSAGVHTGVPGIFSVKQDMEQVVVLGSTGSIGVSTLDVLSRHTHRYRVFALTANHSVDVMFQQCLHHQPLYAVMVSEKAATVLRQRLLVAKLKTEVLSGADALVQIVSDPSVDTVMAAIVGAAGLPASIAAAKAGKKILLANKEALVMAGPLFMNAVLQHKATLLPIDSEHNAIFQCLPEGKVNTGVKRILLTASGGPFRTVPLEMLAQVTPDQACAHPNWRMGRKISVDSATMMNKGLELIEACWLFGVKSGDVEIVIHPQSVVHSMVEYIDGSVLAQMGNPDMRTPIAYGLSWPERMVAGVSSLDLIAQGRLDFEQPDPERFPALALARQACEYGGTAPAILNAANEVAVELFLKNQIVFPDIVNLVKQTLDKVISEPAISSLEQIYAADHAARQAAHALIGNKYLSRQKLS